MRKKYYLCSPKGFSGGGLCVKRCANHANRRPKIKRHVRYLKTEDLRPTTASVVQRIE